jgi:hypothetical protein
MTLKQDTEKGNDKAALYILADIRLSNLPHLL